MALNDGKYCSVFCANRHMHGFHKSFGRPNCFFRFNFTSAVKDIPVAHVHWIHLDNVVDHHTYVVGNMAKTTWEKQPTASDSINPFIILDDIMPGRYAVAYEELLLQKRIRLGFVCLDPSQAVVDTGVFHDFGDDVFPFFKKTYTKTNATSEFIFAEEEDDETDDSSNSLLEQHIPLSVLQFMKQFKQHQHI